MINIISAVPSPVVTISGGDGTSFNRTFITGDGNILCNAALPPVDVLVNVSFTWWGPEGQIMEGDKYELLTYEDQDSNTATGQLVIRNLESRDNQTIYSCSVEVDIDRNRPLTNYSDFITPGTATSDNVSLVFEGE